MKVLFENPATGEKVNFLYQWETGIDFIFDISNGSDVEVAFSTAGIKEAIRKECTNTSGDTWKCKVPDTILQYGTNISAYITFINEDAIRVVDKSEINVRRRPKPAGYVSTTDDTWVTVEQMLERIAESTKNIEAIENNIKSSEAEVKKVKEEVDGKINDFSIEFENYVRDFELLRQQAVADVNNAGQAQAERVEGAGDQAVKAVQDEGAVQKQAVTDEGAAQVQAITDEGTTQVQAVADKGAEVLQSIPKDYTALQAQADANTEDIANLRDYVSDVHKAVTWDEVAKAVSTGLADDMFAIGDEFTNEWTDTAAEKTYENPLRVNHFENAELEDGTVIPGMWLHAHYAHVFGVQFSHQQAFYVADEGLPAGTYCVQFGYTWGSNGYVNNGDYWNFTLTKDVPAGGKLTGFYGAPDQAPSNWKVYVYDSDSRTILETVSVVSGQAGTLLGVMTAYGDDTLNGLQQTAYGNNRWATSALRQYLNSAKPKGEWWTPQSKWDIAPDQLATKDGYLCGMDPELLAVIQPVKTVTYCNTVTAEGKAQIMDVTYDKVTLPSLEQMYINPQIAGEGEAHEYFKQLNGTDTKYAQYGTYEELKHYALENHTSPQGVRLRSANRGLACDAWIVFSSGHVGHSYASHARRFALLVFIGVNPAISAPTDAEIEEE